MKVKLTYFKESGKYYSEGSYDTFFKQPWNIYGEVRAFQEMGILPGLQKDVREFAILISPAEPPADDDKMPLIPHLIYPYKEPSREIPADETDQDARKRLNEIRHRDFLCGIIVTAMEGGIGYWSRSLKYHWKDGSSNSPYDIVEACAYIEHLNPDTGETTGEKYALFPSLIHQGIINTLAKDFQVRSDIRKSIAYASTTEDGGEIDAEAADVIVQAALFGEIQYS